MWRETVKDDFERLREACDAVIQVWLAFGEATPQFHLINAEDHPARVVGADSPAGRSAER